MDNGRDAKIWSIFFVFVYCIHRQLVSTVSISNLISAKRNKEIRSERLFLISNAPDILFVDTDFSKRRRRDDKVEFLSKKNTKNI